MFLLFLNSFHQVHTVKNQCKTGTYQSHLWINNLHDNLSLEQGIRKLWVLKQHVASLVRIVLNTHLHTMPTATMSLLLKTFSHTISCLRRCINKYSNYTSDLVTTMCLNLFLLAIPSVYCNIIYCRSHTAH